MENQRKGCKKLWKPPSFEDFNVESQCKRIKLDEEDVQQTTAGELTVGNGNNPKTIEELATHPKKIEEIKHWFEATQSARAPFLLITGPAGSAKTTTLKVVASSLNISVREWLNPVDKIDFRADIINTDKSEFTESRQTDKFEDFIFRASRYKSLFEDASRNIILIEDFPNIFVWKPKLFHEFLDKYQRIGRSAIVFICTDDPNLNLQNDLFPAAVKVKFNVSEIKFNPVNQSSLMKTLKKAVSKCPQKEAITADTLQSIAQSSNGDLRNALCNLQILVTSFKPGKKPGRRKEGKGRTPKSPTPELISVKDVRAEFYQALGRVLYPKRIKTDGKGLTEHENKERLFVHSVEEIAAGVSDSFLMLLHENYVTTCGDLRSLTDAANVFSVCDVFRGEPELREYAGMISVIGLMTSNREPKREGFKPIKKSSFPWTSAENSWATRFEHSHLNATCRVLNVDYIPYMKVIGGKPVLGDGIEPFIIGSDVDEEDIRIEEYDD